MICRKCGKEIGNEDKICPYCGTETRRRERGSGGNKESYNQSHKQNEPDKGVFLAEILGILGLVLSFSRSKIGILICFAGLYLSYRSLEQRTGDKKRAKIGFLASGAGIIIAVLSFVIIFIAGLFTGGMENKNQTESENSIFSGIEEYADGTEDMSQDYNGALDELPIYSQERLSAYIDANHIEIPKVKKKKEMQKIFSDNGNGVYVKEKKEGQYVATKEETGYLYIGKMKNNKPNGYGKILKMYSATEYEENDHTRIKFSSYKEADTADDIYSVLVYAGEFKKGYFSGYGWKYTIPFENWDDLANSIYGRDLGEDYEHVTDNIQANILETCNPIEYMGEFKKGEYCGEGIQIAYPIREISVESDTTELQEMLGFDISEQIIFYIGEFKNGYRNGQIKEYMFGKLVYSGNEKDNEYNGKGTEYYGETGSIRYEGEWKNGMHHGQGTEYDEDGSVIYSGKWRRGDYAS